MKRACRRLLGFLAVALAALSIASRAGDDTEAGEAALLDAVKSGDIAQVQKLLANGVDADALSAVGTDAWGDIFRRLPKPGPLQTASSTGRADILKALLKAGANPKIKGLDRPAFVRRRTNLATKWGGYDWFLAPSPTNSKQAPEGVICGSALGEAAVRGGLDCVKCLIEDAHLSPDDRELQTSGEENGWTPLMYAALGGKADVASYLISKGASVDAAEPGEGYTALHFAAEHGSVDVLKVLLAAKADVSAKTKVGETPLHLATGCGVEACAALFAAGAAVEPKDETGFTPLHVAALNGNEAVCELLLANKAKADARDVYGRTPLHLAAAAGMEKSCLVLIAAGADPNAKTKFRETPLHLAAASGSVNDLMLLYEAGADVHAKNAIGYTHLHYAAWLNRRQDAALLILRGASLNAAGTDGFTPLHLAVAEGANAVVPLLLVMGADPDAPDADGWTPLHYAAGTEYGSNEYGIELPAQDVLNEMGAFGQFLIKKDKEGRAKRPMLPIFRLLEFGADPNAKTNSGQTPLHISAGAHGLNRNAAIQCAALLDHQANLNAVDSSGRTPLDVAVEGGNTEVEEILRQAGGRYGYAATPKELSIRLRFAIETLDASMARMQLNQGAEPNKFLDGRGGTPLVTAIEGDMVTITVEEVGEYVEEPVIEDQSKENERTDIVRALLKSGADVDGEDEYGDTPLKTAVRAGNEDVVQLLLDAGADPNTAGKRGCPPLHESVRFSMKIAAPIIKALFLAGAKADAKDAEGNNAAEIAAENGNPNVLALLAQYGCKPSRRASVAEDDEGAPENLNWRLLDAVNSGDQNLVQTLVKSGADVNAEGYGYGTAGDVAARNNDLDMLKLLQNLGCRLGAKDAYGRIPFECSLEQVEDNPDNNQPSSEPILRWLLENGYGPKEKEGDSPYIAMIKPLIGPRAVRLLASLGFSLESPLGKEPELVRAASYPELVWTLLELGADPNAAGPTGGTALHAAANGPDGSFSQESVNLLIAAKANVNARDRDGRTPAHEAVQHGRVRMLEALAKAGASFDVPDADGMTPIGLAKAQYDIKMMLWLHHVLLYQAAGLSF